MNAGEIISQCRSEGRTFVDEARAKQILRTFGVRVPRGVLVRTRSQLTDALAKLTLPVAAKLATPDVSHKSDIGGVRLGLASNAAAGDAFDALQRTAADRRLRFEGVLFEEMAPQGQELVIGGIVDRRFGPVLMFGAGGIFVEIFRDIAFRICPVDRIDAAEMIDELRIAPILRGARGRAPVSEEAIVNTLLAVGGAGGLLLQLQDAVSEIDINPLIVSANEAIACDARLILSRETHGEAAA